MLFIQNDYICGYKINPLMKKLHLRNMPDEIHETLIDEQAKARKEEGSPISLERIIYRLIRKATKKDTTD